MKIHFEVWPLNDEMAAVVVDVDPQHNPPQWHLVCDAAIHFAKALPIDCPRPPVVCVRHRRANVIYHIVHYVALVGPPGEGTYAKYLGTTKPPENYQAKPL